MQARWVLFRRWKEMAESRLTGITLDGLLSTAEDYLAGPWPATLTEKGVKESNLLFKEWNFKRSVCVGLGNSPPRVGIPVFWLTSTDDAVAIISWFAECKSCPGWKVGRRKSFDDWWKSMKSEKYRENLFPGKSLGAISTGKRFNGTFVADGCPSCRAPWFCCLASRPSTANKRSKHPVSVWPVA